MAEGAFAALRSEAQTQLDDALMALSIANELADASHKLLDEKKVALKAEKRANQELALQVLNQKEDIAWLE